MKNTFYTIKYIFLYKMNTFFILHNKILFYTIKILFVDDEKNFRHDVNFFPHNEKYFSTL